MYDATTKQVKEFIRDPYAWPGGYPMFALTDDGGVLCKDCTRSEWPAICDSMRSGLSDGWRVVAIDINWESLTFCDHCSNQIETAYGVYE
jgi:hypothetical protein